MADIPRDRPPRAQLVRLTQTQIDAMGRHLFPGVVLPPVSEFMEPDARQNYLINVGVLRDDDDWKDRLGRWAEAVGAAVTDPKHVRRYMTDNPEEGLKRLAAAAGRNVEAGPLGESVIKMFREQLHQGASQAFGHALKAMLTDPVFFYRNETPFEGVTTSADLTDKPKMSARLSDVRYLEYLSFAIADAPPAALKLDPKDASRLVGTPEAVRTTIAAIQNSPEGRKKLTDFFQTWARVPDTAEDFQVNPDGAPDYTPAMGEQMIKHARGFLEARLNPSIARPTLASVTLDHWRLESGPLAARYAGTPYASYAPGIFGTPASITGVDRGRNDPWSNGYVQRSMFLARTALGFPFTGIPEDVLRELNAKRKVDAAYFAGKKITTATGEVTITPDMAKQIAQYLVANNYVSNQQMLIGDYVIAKESGTFAPLPPELAPHTRQIMALIDTAAQPAYDPKGYKDQADFIEAITGGNAYCANCHGAANPVGRGVAGIGPMARPRPTDASGAEVRATASFPVEAFGYTGAKEGDYIGGLRVKLFQNEEGDMKPYVQTTDASQAMRFLMETPFFKAKAAEHLYAFYNLNEPTKGQLTTIAQTYDHLTRTASSGGDLLGALAMVLPREREHDPAMTLKELEGLFSPDILERSRQLGARVGPAEIDRLQEYLRTVPRPSPPAVPFKKSELTPGSSPIIGSPTLALGALIEHPTVAELIDRDPIFKKLRDDPRTQLSDVATSEPEDKGPAAAARSADKPQPATQNRLA